MSVCFFPFDSVYGTIIAPIIFSQNVFHYLTHDDTITLHITGNKVNYDTTLHIATESENMWRKTSNQTRNYLPHYLFDRYSVYSHRNECVKLIKSYNHPSHSIQFDYPFTCFASNCMIINGTWKSVKIPRINRMKKEEQLS